MVDHSYGFLSGSGEAFARRLLGGIVADVSADAGRRRALDRISDALEQISERDGAHPEQVTLDALAAKLSDPFGRAGFVLPTGTEIRDHWDGWSRRGTPAGPLSSCPDAASRAGAFACAASAAAARLAGMPGVRVASAKVAPWEDGFCDADGNPPGAVVFFPWRGDVSGVHLIGIALLGPDGASYLDEMHGDISGYLSDGALAVPDGSDPAALASALSDLRDAATKFNEASSYLADPARLCVGVSDATAPVLIATWDGEAIREAHRAPEGRFARPAAPAPKGKAPRAADAALEAFDQISFAPAAAPPGMR